jgi:hypothetical protein
VTWLSPLGGSFDDRYDEASSASTPTTVRPEEGPGDTEGGGDDTGPKPPSETDVEIVRYPGHVVASAPTELRVQWTWDEPGPGILFVQRVDADTGGLVDLLVSDVGMDGRPFVQDFVFPARGARSVFFVACLGALEEISTGTCVARDSTEARPTSVVVPIASSRGGLCAVSERAPGVALVLVSSCLLAGLARRRRSGSSQLGRPVDGPRRAS